MVSALNQTVITVGIIDNARTGNLTYAEALCPCVSRSCGSSNMSNEPILSLYEKQNHSIEQVWDLD